MCSILPCAALNKSGMPGCRAGHMKPVSNREEGYDRDHILPGILLWNGLDWLLQDNPVDGMYYIQDWHQNTFRLYGNLNIELQNDPAQVGKMND